MLGFFSTVGSGNIIINRIASILIARKELELFVTLEGDTKKIELEKFKIEENDVLDVF
jgi:hypothetical protein